NLHGTQIQVNQLAELSTQFKILFTLHDSWLTTGSSNHPFELESSGLSLLDMQDWKAKLAQRKSAITNSAIRFTAPSQWMRERFFITHNIRPFFVPNAIAKCESTNVEIPSNRFILFVANNPEFNPYKDFDTLVKAWKKANDALGENEVDLVCIGCKSNSKEKFGDHHFYRLERMRAEQINSYLAASLFVIQASKQDNSPLGILEAHQQKKRVLASLVGGIPELLNQQEKSWLYEPENSTDLTTKLITAVQFIDSNNETDLVSPHTELETMANTYLGHYRDLVNG
ncbi:MAG: glycosyltransferase, partial [Flavobacteriales bacterium]